MSTNQRVGILLASADGVWAINTYSSTEGGSVPLNQWSHIAITREGTSLRVFIDGVLQYTKTINFNIYWPSQVARIGSDAGESVTFSGYISDLRLVKGTALYTANFTPPTERLEAITNTSLLTCHLPYIKDGSTNNHSITVNGNVSAKPFTPYDYSEYDTATHGGSIYFDGSDADRLVIGAGEVDLGSSTDFTVEFYYRPTTVSTRQMLVCYGTNSSGFGAGEFFIQHHETLGGLRVFINTVTIGYKSISANNWYHIAFTKQGTSFKFFVNGSQVGSTLTNSTSMGSSQRVEIGDYATLGQPVTGYISDVRIVSGTAVYTSNFTPPTEPLTAITNTSLLISGTDASIVDKSQSANLTLVDSTQSSTSQTKYASSSIYFDGSDRIDLPNPSIPALSGDFTFEAWIYPTAVNYGAIFARGFAYGGGLLIWIQTNFNARFYRDDGVQLNIQSGSSISANQWTHIAVTRQGSNVKTFINGTVDQTAIMDPANYGLGNTSKFEIGAFNDNQQYFNGYMEDVRITNGLARYTANFTPPSASLEA
jgi:hypothetical protein